MRPALMLLLAIVALGLAPRPAVAQGTPFAPVAVVNGDAITGYDLDQRMRLIQLFTGAKPDSRALQNAALDQLVEDRLKLQAGKRMGITPSAEMLASALETFATTRRVSVDELTARAAKAGISELALKDLVAADAVWREVVRGRFLGRVEPSSAEIDAEMGKAGGGNTVYRLQEIGIPVRQGRETETETLARQLYADLSAGGDFAAAVRKYSRAPSAPQDGEVGWVGKGQLPPALAENLAGLQPGQVSPPIRVPAGWSIVKLLDRREGAEAAATTAAAGGAAGGGGSGGGDQREIARARIIDQRLGRMADGLLQELRRDALIEVR